MAAHQLHSFALLGIRYGQAVLAKFGSPVPDFVVEHKQGTEKVIRFQEDGAVGTSEAAREYFWLRLSDPDASITLVAHVQDIEASEGPSLRTLVSTALDSSGMKVVAMQNYLPPLVGEPAAMVGQVVVVFS